MELRRKILDEIATGATPKECAEKYNTPAGTIRSWLSRERSKSNATQRKKRSATKQRNATKKKQTKEPKITIEDVSYELTEKQRLFCLIYIRNFNATQAAIKAGYSPDSARQIGCELLTKHNIRTEIDRLKEIKAQSIMITEDDIIERYMRIAFADMTDFTEFGTEMIPAIEPSGKQAVDDRGNPLYIRTNHLYFHGSDRVDGGLICEISKGKQGMKIKLEDRQKALDWLANFFNMNPVNKHKQKYDEAKLRLEQERLEIEKKKNW